MLADREIKARAALVTLSERDREDVLSTLCGTRPEAVLFAIESVQRHRAVIAQLRSDTPPMF